MKRKRAYAPTYYPGVGSINEARAVSVSVSQQSVDVNFNMLLVRTAPHHGNGHEPRRLAEHERRGELDSEGIARPWAGPAGADFGGRISWDGKFTIANVPPGTYTLRARGNDTEVPQYAVQPLTVTNGDVSGVSVVLYPGATISGTVSVDGANLPDLTQVRITAPSAENATIGPNPNARVEKDGRFTLEGVPAGAALDSFGRAAGLVAQIGDRRQPRCRRSRRSNPQRSETDQRRDRVHRPADRNQRHDHRRTVDADHRLHCARVSRLTRTCGGRSPARSRPAGPIRMASSRSAACRPATTTGHGRSGRTG